MLSVTEAVRRILDLAPPQDSEYVALDQTLFRVLATELLTTEDLPRFDKSMMDGFVVCLDNRGLDVAQPISFPIVDTITAGSVSSAILKPGEAARIMTGAAVPEGGSCIVPIEAVTVNETTGQVSIPFALLRSESHILRRGVIATAGSPLLRFGTRLQPQQIAALAEHGYAQVPVLRRPSVAVLATGDELVGVEQTPAAGMIRNSNEPMLVAQASATGAQVIGLGIARDTLDSLKPLIAAGLKHDVLLLSGGVSAGILDLVPSQLADAGVRQIFHGVHMKPGKPLWFGVLDRMSPCEASGVRRTYVFGLPGNPVSSLACFELFVRPLLNAMQAAPAQSAVTASLTEAFSVTGDRPVYQPAYLFIRNSQLMAAAIAWSSSSDLKATVEANGMIELLPEHGKYNAGSIVRGWLWGDQRLTSGR